MKARRSIVGQVANLRPIGNRPVATPNLFSTGCAGLSTVQPAFSRLACSRGALSFCRRRLSREPLGYYPCPMPFFACRDDFVGQIANLQPIDNRPPAGHGETSAPSCGLSLCTTIHTLLRAPRRFCGAGCQPAADWGRPLGPACFCGAANPGCSRLSAGSLHPYARRSLPQHTLPSDRPALVRTRFGLTAHIERAGLFRHMQAGKPATSFERPGWRFTGCLCNHASPVSRTLANHATPAAPLQKYHQHYSCAQPNCGLYSKHICLFSCYCLRMPWRPGASPLTT
jgi:hypothetical protein